MLWQYGKGTPYVPSPLLLGDRLYFTQTNDALLTIARRQDGQAGPRPRARCRAEASFYASPLAAAGRIYLVDRDGTTLVLKEGDKLEVLATNKLDDPHSTPRRWPSASNCFCAARSICTALRQSRPGCFGN